MQSEFLHLCAMLPCSVPSWGPAGAILNLVQARPHVQTSCTGTRPHTPLILSSVKKDALAGILPIKYHP